MIKTKFLPLVLCLALSPLHAAAQTSVDEVVRLDVLDGGQTARGTYLAALRLTLQDGWKTYWRAPGEAGIPPQFSWAGSQNVAATAITWPTPHVFDQNGMRSIGYKSQLVLPIEITPKQADRRVRLRGEMQLGVCREVCIPAELRFDRALDAGAGRNPAIAAALAARPYSAPEAGVTSVTCRTEAAEDGLKLTAHIAMPPAGGAEYAVIEPGHPELWASEAEVSRDGAVLTVASDITKPGGGAYALNRSALRITVLGQSHAVDIRGCSAD